MVRQTGAALSIPGLLLAGPLVGYGLGWVAAHYLGCPKWSPVAGLVFGLVSGIRESVIIIQKMAQESEKDSDE
jgi:F0F1-type ATP synthase assembly protein I